MSLVPLPRQPDGVTWPTHEWPSGDAPPGLDELVDAAFDVDGPLATTYAVAVVQSGRLLAERYGGALEHWDRPHEPVTRSTPLLSWSMAKSMLHAVIGMLVDERRLDLDAPAPVPLWAAPGDDRRSITLEHLLCMRDGLAFVEDYVDDTASDVIEMLFGSGQDDVAAFAANRPLAAPPGSRFNYSSGTTNILSGIAARALGPGEAYRSFLDDRLFGPIGMASATPRFDTAGTWIASSYVHATAQDFARFGLLYLRDGVWDGRRVLPSGWVDHGRRHRSDDADGTGYGAQWWVPHVRRGTFAAYGYDGQRIVVVPALDAIVVRLGKTPRDRAEHLDSWCQAVVELLAASSD